MPFAQMGELGWAAGWLGGAAALVVAIRTSYQVWHTVRQERNASAVGQLETAADRLQAELERRDRDAERHLAHVAALDDQNAQLWRERADCEADLDAVHNYLGVLWRHLKAGGQLAHLPEPPTRRPRPDRAEGEFRRRTTEQATTLLTAELPPEPPSGGGGAT